MMREWKTYILKDAVYINPYVSLRKGTTAKKVSMDKLQPNNRYIPAYEFAEYSGGAKFVNGDTIMARITPCLENGKIAQVNILDEGEVGFGSTEYIVFRAKEGITDKDFVYSLVCSNFIREPAVKSMVGSSNRQRVQTDVVENLEIAFPPLDEQIKIGAFLRSLDDKIESNKRINDFLLNQIQAIYDSWFKKYEPFSSENYVDTEMGRVPTNWAIGNIYEIANIIYGAPFASALFNSNKQGKPIIRIRDLKEQCLDTYTTEVHSKGYLLHLGDIVVGMDGEFRPYIWGNEEAWLNQRVCVFDNKRAKGKAFLFCAIKPLLRYIEETESATTVIHIGKKDFDAFRIVIPEEKVMHEFEEQTDDMYWKIVHNWAENRRLTALRDTLLPKLMSGEIDVSNVQI